MQVVLCNDEPTAGGETGVPLRDQVRARLGGRGVTDVVCSLQTATLMLEAMLVLATCIALLGGHQT